MSKKRKKSINHDYDEIEREILRDKVDEIFRDHPHDYISRLEEIGFEYFEDDMPDEEEEERKAKPENQRQINLIDFFENRKGLSEKIFTSFCDEKAAEDTNYPLIRRYFKNANQNLKALILYGLEKHPDRIDLLFDLAFFHEFENILSILIKYFTRACIEQEDLDTFSQLAMEFYYSTCPDGYDAYSALKDLFEPGTQKRKIIDSFIHEREKVDRVSDIPIEVDSKNPAKKLH